MSAEPHQTESSPLFTITAQGTFVSHRILPWLLLALVLVGAALSGDQLGEVVRILAMLLIPRVTPLP